jgi:hypothetical protein
MAKLGETAGTAVGVGVGVFFFFARTGKAVEKSNRRTTKGRYLFIPSLLIVEDFK